MDYKKYPKTLHLPWSPNLQNDDRRIDNLDGFIGKEVVVTEKLDGENTTGYFNGHIHARSLETEYHPSRTWVKQFLSSRLPELPKNWRLCGENLYAKHSIHYLRLHSYFYLFSIWNENNYCLSWDDTIEWANLLNIEVVPVIYRGIWDEKEIKQCWIEYNTMNTGDNIEGYVVRTVEGFNYENFQSCVAKYVRKNHVQTSEHWMKQAVVKNECI